MLRQTYSLTLNGEDMGILCNSAQLLIFSFPKMLASSIIASTSSAELKNGKRLVRKLNKTTPHDHTSISNCQLK